MKNFYGMSGKMILKWLEENGYKQENQAGLWHGGFSKDKTIYTVYNGSLIAATAAEEAK